MLGYNIGSQFRLRRNLLYAIIAITIISLTAAGSQVAAFSFVDSVKEFLGVKSEQAFLPDQSAFGIFPAPAPPPVVCTTAPNGMISWWAAENNPGDNLNRNNGVLQGNAGFVAGIVGNAFDLDGTGDYVQITSPTGLPVGNSARTVELWFRAPATPGESGLFQYGSAATGQMFGLITSGNAPGRLYFYGHSADLASATSIQPNTWYHGAVTYDGTTVNVFVNGILENSAPIALNTALNTNGITIGHRAGGSFWTGQLDEPTIYDRALSAAEILAIYNAGSAGKCSECTPSPNGIVGWWGGNGNSQDLISGNNGTLVNGATFAPGKVDQAFSLNQSNSTYVDLPAATSNLLNNSAGSISAWVNPSAVGDNDIVAAFGTGNAGEGVGIGIYGNVRIYHHTSTYDWQSNTPISANTWTHITYTWDSTTERIYKDGVFSESRPRNFSYVPGSARIGHGWWGDPANYFPGLIDEVDIYNRTLDGAEIAAIYNAGAAGKCVSCSPTPSGIVGWWPANGNGYDIVSGNNGTLVNGVTFALGSVGQAFSFNQVDQQFVELPFGTTSQLLTNSAGSISAWVNQAPVAVSQFHMATAFGSGAAGEAVGFGIDNGNVRVYHHTDTFDWQTGVPVTVSTWTLITYTWDSTTERLYRNGALAATRPRNFNYVPGFARIGFGFINDPSVFFSGQIDEVTTFNRTLDATEIVEIYNAGSLGMCATCTPPPPNMTQWWPGDGNANDIQGPTFENGTAVNGATFAVGFVGDAFSFDGGNKYFEFPASVADFGAQPFTVDFWMYSHIEGNGTYIVGKSHADGGAGWDFRLHDHKLHLVGTNGWPPNFNWESDRSLSPNVWHHIAVAAGTSQISVYIDGVLKGTPPRSAISSAPNPFRIGFTTNFGGSPFNGRIDEVEIFDRTLTANEIQSIYSAGSLGKCKPDGTPTPTPTPMDLGDAPDAYATTLANNGARHQILTGFSLGATEDAESDGQPSANADGDGADEDGVTLPVSPLVAGGSANITVMLANTAAVATPLLDAWIDFDGNASFDVGEKFANSVALTAGANIISVTTPGGAATGTTYARFRLSSTGMLSPTGLAADGEVEDYTVIISSPPPQFSINDVSGAEGNAGTSNFTFTITKTGNNQLPSIVYFSTQDGTAMVADNDYQPIDPPIRPENNVGSVYFAAEDTSKTVTVLINGDTKVEPDETFTLHLNATDNGSFSDADGRGTIINDDCTPPPPQMVSWWPGEGNANDIQGPTFENGLALNGAAYAPGKVGQAFSFDGVDSYVRADNTINIDGGPQATYDAWVYPTAVPEVGLYFGIMGAGDSTTSTWTAQQCRLLYWRTDASPAGSARFYIDCGLDDNEHYYSRLSASNYPMNTWHFVAATFNNGALNIYVNGVLDNGDTAGTGGSVLNTASLNYVWIGAHVRNDSSLITVPFAGLIDEAEIFDRALTPPEIQAIYNAGSAGKCSTGCVQPHAEMISWWDGDGTPNDIIGTNEGTLMSGASYGAGMVGQAFDFSQAGQHVEIPDSPTLRPVNGLSIDGWFKFNNSNPQAALVSKPFLSGSSNAYVVWIQGGALWASVNGAYVNYAFDPTPGRWYHIAYTYDTASAQHRLFVDGSGVASGVSATTPTYDSSPVLIGIDKDNGSPVLHMVGVADEVEFFGRALTGNEVLSIYRAGSAGKCKPVATPTPTPGPANTTTTVTSSHHPSIFGESVTFTATVTSAAIPDSPAAAGPTGTVTFNIDGILYCINSPLNTSSFAQCTQAGLPAMAAGIRNVVAVYSGDSNFLGSAGTFNQTVDKAGTAIVITGDSPDPSAVNQPYAVTWSTTITAPGAGTPIGNVAVADGAGGTCTAPIAVGTCNFTSATIGPKTLVATYTGGANFNGSVSAGESHTVSNLSITGNVKLYVPGGPYPNLGGVSITAAGPVNGMAITDAGGNYTLTGLVPGNYTVTPSSPGRVFDPVSRVYTGIANNITGADFFAYDSVNQAPRSLTFATETVEPGGVVSMPVILNAQGDEVMVKFSFGYDINPIAVAPTVVCGSDGPSCTVVTDTSILGRVGVTVTAGSGGFTRTEATGDMEIALINFQTIATSLPNTPIDFVATPVPSRTLNAANDLLLTKYVPGWIVFAQGLEGDVAGRHAGSGSPDAVDVVQVRRFVTDLDIPIMEYNEFQRADTAPGTTRGDGILDATDVIQTRRYAAGLDLPQEAGGLAAAGVLSRPDNDTAHIDGEKRSVIVGSTSAAAGSRIAVPVVLVPNAEESAISFVLKYDQAKLGDPVIELGDAFYNATLTANTEEPGVIRVLVDAAAPFGPSSKEARSIVNISFDVAMTAASGDTQLDIEECVIADANAVAIAAAITSGTVSIAGPNPAGVEIGGRVLTSKGRGIRDVAVVLVDKDRNARTVLTGTFGHYRFRGVSPDAWYLINARSRRFRFAPLRLHVTGPMDDVDLIAQE